MKKARRPQESAAEKAARARVAGAVGLLLRVPATTNRKAARMEDS